MTSFPVSYIVVGENSTNLKVKCGTVTKCTQDLWAHTFIRKKLFLINLML